MVAARHFPIAVTAHRAGDIARLHELTFAPAWDVASIERLMAAPGSLTMIVDSDRTGGLAGFVMGRRVADEAEIMMLAVAPEERRRGIGRALVDTLATAVGADGALRLFLEVAVDNVEAIALYRRAGFNVVGQRAGYYHRSSGPAVDALTLARELA